MQALVSLSHRRLAALLLAALTSSLSLIGATAISGAATLPRVDTRSISMRSSPLSSISSSAMLRTIPAAPCAAFIKNPPPSSHYTDLSRSINVICNAVIEKDTATDIDNEHVKLERLYHLLHEVLQVLHADVNQDKSEDYQLAVDHLWRGHESSQSEDGTISETDNKQIDVYRQYIGRVAEKLRDNLPALENIFLMTGNNLAIQHNDGDIVCGSVALVSALNIIHEALIESAYGSRCCVISIPEETAAAMQKFETALFQAIDQFGSIERPDEETMDYFWYNRILTLAWLSLEYYFRH